MFRWFHQRPLRRVLRGIEQGRGAIESVLGLPHVLARPLVERHFGTLATPSDEAFRESGRNGFWQLPAPHPAIELKVAAGDDGRLTEGLIRLSDDWSGLVLYSEWDPGEPEPRWQIRLVPPFGERLDELYRALTGEPLPDTSSE
ncbi:MAG: hypothetical protein ACQERR_02980 [Pseudomonadota bacterium]